MVLPLGFFEFFGFQGILILAVLGVLLYGERLPEVAASFGKQLLHLKKAVQGIRDEIESVTRDTTHTLDRSIEHVQDSLYEETTAPKFEPPPAEPDASGPVATGQVVEGPVAESHASLAGSASDKHHDSGV